MNTKVLFCNNCDEEREYQKKQTEITHEIKGELIKINIDIPYCVICGNQLSDLETENTHYELALEIYRKTHNLLTAEEIKEIRQMYKLSQRAFARALGFAEATINRYELGALQDTLHNNMLLLCKEPSNFLILINQNRANLSEKEYLDIKKEIEILKHKKNIYESVSNDISDRLELMVFGLSKKVDALEKRLNNPFYERAFTPKLYNTCDRRNVFSTTWEHAMSDKLERN